MALTRQDIEEFRLEDYFQGSLEAPSRLRKNPVRAVQLDGTR